MSEVILVNMNDEPNGKMDKQQAHELARLHRAFSIFLFHDNQLLLQKRAAGKYHCGGLWTNTCCSHPAPGENLYAAGQRRLQEELGITGVKLKEAGSFVYRFPFNNGLTEFEFDHILIGEYNGPANPDMNEVADLRWENINHILESCAENAESYTPWFLTAIKIALDARSI